jgi:xylulokinase
MVPKDGAYGAALGAARLAMMAATGAGIEVATRPEIANTIAPEPQFTQAFADAHYRYRAAYDALKNL